MPEQRNKRILDDVRAVSIKPLTEILPSLPTDLVKGAIAGEHFQELFFANATDDAVIALVKKLLEQ